VSRLIFWRSGLTIAEHLIVCMYLLGHAVLLLAILQLTVPFAAGTMLYVLGFGGLGAALGYFVWGYSSIFWMRRGLAAIGGFVALGGGMLLWAAAIAGLLHFLRH
jgi:hypothetical protein